jgi:hypothetical protein
MTMLTASRRSMVRHAGVVLAVLSLTAPTFGASEFVSLDDQYARVADEMPGFGGLYFDDHGRLTINLRPAGKEISGAEKVAVMSALERVFGRERLAGPLGADGNRLVTKPPSSTTTQFRKADFGYGELYRWRTLAVDVFAVDGVRTLDLDEAANRIVVGVADEERHGDDVIQWLSAYGIPAAAVVVRETGELIPFDHTVADQLTPKVGGIRIESSSGGCTIGYNVDWPFLWWRANGFVTAGHCTATFGEENATSFFQPESPAFVGVEHADPPFRADLRGCPRDMTCRFSDTALIEYNDRSMPGVVAKPLHWLASLEIDHASPIFRIIGTAPVQMVGDVLDKVGGSTGWTVSKIERTCQDIELPDDRLLLCQHSTFLDEYPDIPVNLTLADRGDSGAPVFVWGLQANISIAGTLVGGVATRPFGPPDRRRYVYSPIFNILADLGTAAIPLTR